MARKRKRAVSASPDSSGDDDDGIIDLSQEPKPTTDVIPYENGTDIVGKRIHMLYEYTDEDTGATSFRFYRGVVGRKVGAAGNTYRLDFDDGEKKTVNLTKPSETIRWETGDITRGGRWKTAKDAGIADVVKSPERQRGKAKEWWKEGAPQSEGGERNEPTKGDGSTKKKKENENEKENEKKNETPLDLGCVGPPAAECPLPLPVAMAKARMAKANATVFFEKELSQSNVFGRNAGQVGVPKDIAEAHFPSVEPKAWCSVVVSDIFGGVHTLKLKCKPNRDSRTYSLVDGADLFNLFNLGVADVLVIGRDKEGRYVVCGRHGGEEEVEIDDLDEVVEEAAEEAAEEEEMGEELSDDFSISDGGPHDGHGDNDGHGDLEIDWPIAPEPMPLQPERAAQLMQQIGATTLYEKLVSKTDLYHKQATPRFSINNEFVDQVLPRVEDSSGIDLSPIDVFGNRHSVMLRFNKSSAASLGRDYFLGDPKSVVQFYNLKAGDVLSIGKVGTGPDAQIVVCGRVAPVDDPIRGGLRCNRFWLQRENQGFLRDAEPSTLPANGGTEPVSLQPDRAISLLQQLKVTNLYEKVISKTDCPVGLTGKWRIFLNREFSKEHIPVEVGNKEGSDVPMVDVFGQTHQVRIRYQSDTTSGDRPIMSDPLSVVDVYDLKMGDVLMIAKDGDGRLIVCGRKATDADASLEKRGKSFANAGWPFNPWNARPAKGLPHRPSAPQHVGFARAKAAVDQHKVAFDRRLGPGTSSIAPMAAPDRHAKPSSAPKVEPKKPVVIPQREPPRPKTDEITELRASIQTAGKDFLGALRSLQAASTQLETLNNTLKTFTLRSDLQAEQLAAVAKGARGLLNHVLRPKAEFRNAKDMGLERVWPLNDLVMKPVSTLHATSNALCHKANLPPITDGGVLDAWKRSKQQLAEQDFLDNHDAAIPNAMDGSATPNDKKREREADLLGEASRANSGVAFPSPISRGDANLRTPKQSRQDRDLFPTTGSKVRDDALKILAHSLMSSVATPYEVAVDMEAAVFKRFPPGEKGTFPDEYYSTVMGARDVLNVDSERCRELVRLMVLEGFISADTFVSATAEELEAQLDAFRKKLG